MTDELDGDVITEFVSGFAKNYGYNTRVGKVVCKVRGFTLNVLAELDNTLDYRRTLHVVTSYYFQRDLENKRIKVMPRVIQYG